MTGRTRAVARVLEPVETAGLTKEDMPTLRNRVRTMLAEAREELERELSGAEG